jgi:hypothetical protein
MTDVFSTPDDLGEPSASSWHTSLGDSLSAQASQAVEGASHTLWRDVGFFGAEHGWTPPQSPSDPRLQEPWGPSSQPAPAPDVSIDDAKARVKQEGLDGFMKLPDQDTIRAPVLDMMMQDAREKAQYNAAIARGPQGFVPDALGFITQVGAGMVDPLNAAAFSIPIMGEARYGKILASAGESIAGRTAIRAGVGVAQGAVGGAALLPADWWLHTQDGQDYTMADALKSVVLSAGMGSAFHAGGGAVGDLYARARGRPLFGTIDDLRARALAGDTHAAEIVEQLGAAGTHLPEAALSDDGLAAEAVPGVTPPAEQLPAHPADVIADLPQRAQEDLVHATAADLVKGEPARGGELLLEAAKEDPRIAQTIDAFHGSPHDFDQFDMSKLGIGEGAQSYGHGLYLAENGDVAAQYRKTTSYKSFIRKVQELYGEHDSPSEAAAALEESKEFSPGERELLKALHEDDWLGFDYPHQAVSAVVHEPEAFSDISDRTKEALRNFGNVYKVKVHANPEHFLDWDKPLKEQPALLDKFRQIVKPELRQAFDANVEHGISGANAYHNYIGDGRGGAAASEALRAAGVPGIKYLDQGSRAMRDLGEQRATQAALKARLAEPDLHPELRKQIEQSVAKNEEELAQPRTRNFVVFDDKLIRITHKNGKEIPLEAARFGRKGEGARPAGETFGSPGDSEASAQSPPRSRQDNIGQAAAADNASPTIGAPAKGRGPRGRDPNTYSLMEFLASEGGIRDDDPLIGDLRGSVGKNKLVPGFGSLIRKPRELSTAARQGGARAPMTLDMARQAAVHGGYLSDAGDVHGGNGTSTISDLLEAIDKEARGDKQYRAGAGAADRPVDPAELEHHRHGLEQNLDEAMKESGLDPKALAGPLRARVLQIMEHEGERDPIDAYERAAMEEDLRGVEAGQLEPNPEAIPGWDKLDDTGAASPAGAAAEGSGDAEGAGNGTPPREPGQGDRGARQGAQPGEVGDWKKFAERGPVDEDLAQASREADETKAPTSAEQPAKSVSAAEAAAGEADKLLADILPKLTKEERKGFEDKLAELADDRAAREQIVRDGAACLAAAGVGGAA